jgi:RHS repeat-associated protein
MPTRLRSTVPQPDLTDIDGTRVSRPDLEVTYVDEVRYDEFLEARFLRTGTGVETRWDRDPDRRFLTGIATDSTVATQFDGTTSRARPLQRLAYAYDPVGNVLDAANVLYDGGGATSLAGLGRVPENNVPGPAQHAYSYDGHYRLTGAEGRYVDRQEVRDYTFETDHAPNGNLLETSQLTTTTGTTGSGGANTCGNGKGSSKQILDASPKGNAKKGDGSAIPDDGSSTPTTSCDPNTGSGGGAANQDPTTTFVLAPEDVAYDADHPHRLVRAGDSTYDFDDNGNLTRWVQPCTSGRSSELVRDLEYDAENRLVYLGQGSNDTEYRYNAEGARTLERGPGGQIWSVNEHWRVENDGHRYANVFLGETMVASHRSSRPDPLPPCDLAVDDCDPGPDLTIHFLHSDLQGSLRVATDERGGVFQYLEYLPTGAPWVAGQSRIKDTPYLFAGGWTDATYKIVNFGERWYDPREQRFSSPEPLLLDDPGTVVNDPSLLAAYTYASSNPLRYVDRGGRAPFDLGANNEKHLQGDVSISVTRREARSAPAITFGGRYSNDAAGQATQASFQKHADRAERFTTVLSIETDRKRVRIFGKTVTKQPAPAAAPGQTGATTPRTTPPTTTPPARPTTPAPTSGATAGTGTAGGAVGGSGATPSLSPSAGGASGGTPTTPPPRPPSPPPPPPKTTGPPVTPKPT